MPTITLPEIEVRSDQSNAPVNIVSEQGLLASISNQFKSVQQAIEENERANRRIDGLQFPADRPKFFFVMSFSRYSRNDLLSVNANLNTERNIILPLPLQITDTHSVSYNNTELGMFIGYAGQKLYEGIRKNQEAGALSATEMAKATGEATSTVFGAEGAATGGAYLADQTSLGPAFQAAFGYSPNKFFTVLLDGPVYKTFHFDWKLVPRNYNESERIREIIRNLNNYMAPGLATGGGALFSFPMVVRCAFMPNFKHLFRFKPAVIKDIQVNYTPAGQPSFYHGANNGDHPPESVELRIILQEMEYWLQGDFTDDYGSADGTTGPRTHELDDYLRDSLGQYFQNNPNNEGNNNG